MVLHLRNKLSTNVTRSLWIVCPKVALDCDRIEDFGANVTSNVSILMHSLLVIVKATRVRKLDATLNAQDWSFWFVLFRLFWSKRLGSLTGVLAQTFNSLPTLGAVLVAHVENLELCQLLPRSLPLRVALALLLQGLLVGNLHAPHLLLFAELLERFHLFVGVLVDFLVPFQVACLLERFFANITCELVFGVFSAFVLPKKFL